MVFFLVCLPSPSWFAKDEDMALHMPPLFIGNWGTRHLAEQKGVWLGLVSRRPDPSWLSHFCLAM